MSYCHTWTHIIDLSHHMTLDNYDISLINRNFVNKSSVKERKNNISLSFFPIDTLDFRSPGMYFFPFGTQRLFRLGEI